ncbi:MFS transporter [Pseudofrankia sp. BMG5.36]|uniref:MFS transporter n=1 Tax=Pseudofrankia sp. BMG5.36 TaxID=1834512 RepID=UPI0008D95479|nr:MFS transporter [Pseudofrankia sp. BMG5.36]OHV45550.1 MFS transporter [Pseudofrankia sp. BMG5.36]
MYAFLEECVPFYALYALLFADSGVSTAGISALFALWSATTFLLEIPSGVWADVVSRRRLLTFAPVLDAAGYALWTVAPSLWSFAVGFVLLGAGVALRSGALQALVYAELDRLGATAAYPRLIGRSQAAGGAAGLLATALAGPLVAVGGYLAVGAVSVAALLLCAAAGRALPDRPPVDGAAGGTGGDNGGQDGCAAAPDEDTVPDDERSGLAVLRSGLAVVRRSAPVRRMLLLSAALTGVAALDEYVPLLVRDTGAAPAAVPLLVLAVTAGATLGGLFAGRGGRLLPALLAVAAVLLAVGAGSGRPVGIAGVAVAFGIFYWALAQADARLQDSLDDTSRATVTSLSGAGMEAVGIATFAAYGAGADGLGLSARWLFAAAAVPYLLLVLPAAARRARSRSQASP